MAKTVDSKKHKRSAYFSKDKSDKQQREATGEYKRSIHYAWDYEFENPEQYVEAKLIMLQNEMYINLTVEEIFHLKGLKTRGDIDRAVQSIIARHWGEC